MTSASIPFCDFPSDTFSDGGAGWNPRNKRDARFQSRHGKHAKRAEYNASLTAAKIIPDRALNGSVTSGQA